MNVQCTVVHCTVVRMRRPGVKGMRKENKSRRRKAEYDKEKNKLGRRNVRWRK